MLTPAIKEILAEINSYPRSYPIHVRPSSLKRAANISLFHVSVGEFPIDYFTEAEVLIWLSGVYYGGVYDG